MDADDVPVGRLLSRREALSLLGVGGVALLAGCGSGSAEASGAAPPPAALGSPCVVKPEATEGPFFFEGDLFRRDIRQDTSSGAVSAGVPLALTVGVTRIEAAACVPLEGAIVDVWHCDAGGRYSGYAREGTDGQNFLRGVQRTDAGGEASFLTVYPGWYRGRAVHIHLKVRTDETADAYEFTSQLYFPDALTDAVFAREPYAQYDHRPTRNARDGIYARGGNQLLLSPTPDDAGYTARFDLALDLSDTETGASDGFGRRG